MAQRKGSILILVLFVMVVLSMAAVSFAYRAGLERRLSTHGAVSARLRAHAASAVAVALARLAENANEFDHLAEPWHTHEPLAAEGWLPEWSATSDGSPPVFVTDYQVIDEEGKLNVLFASSEALEKLSLSAAQIACLFDWMDGDDVVQAEGAETDYYQRTVASHLCKDSPLELLEELLLIRGFVLSDYYGEDADHDRTLDPCEDDGAASDPLDDADRSLRLGLVDLLTCVGDGRINLNTAPAAVLETLPLSDGAVGQIIGFRDFDENSSGDIEDHVFLSTEDIAALQGLTSADRSVLSAVGRFRSEHFRVFVQSRHLKTGLSYCLEILVKMAGQRPEVLQWKVVRQHG